MDTGGGEVGVVPINPRSREDLALDIDVDHVLRTAGLQALLDAVVVITGLRFAAVARVTDTRWTAVVVHDLLGVGAQPGQELASETMLCKDVQRSGQPIFFEVTSNEERYRDHPTPLMHGFETYVSLPVHLPDSTFFGTLCALDTQSASLTPETIQMLQRFAVAMGRRLAVDSTPDRS